MNCSICLDSYEKDAKKEDILSTTCGHVFHQTCILPWIEKSKNCPDCRSVLNSSNVIKLYLFGEESATKSTTGTVETCSKVFGTRASVNKKTVTTKDAAAECNGAKEFSTIKTELAAVKLERKEWMSKCKKLEKSFDTFKTRISVKSEATTAKLRELRSEKRRFQAQIKKLEKELEKKTSKETSLEEEIQIQKSAHQEIVNKLKTDIEALEDQVRNLKDDNLITKVQAKALESGILKKRAKLQPAVRRTVKKMKPVLVLDSDSD